MYATWILREARKCGVTFDLSGRRVRIICPPGSKASEYLEADAQDKREGLLSMLNDPQCSHGNLTPKIAYQRYGIRMRGKVIPLLSDACRKGYLVLPANGRHMQSNAMNAWLRHCHCLQIPLVEADCSEVQALIHLEMPEGQELSPEGRMELLRIAEGAGRSRRAARIGAVTDRTATIEGWAKDADLLCATVRDLAAEYAQPAPKPSGLSGQSGLSR